MDREKFFECCNALGMMVAAALLGVTLAWVLCRAATVGRGEQGEQGVAGQQGEPGTEADCEAIHAELLERISQVAVRVDKLETRVTELEKRCKK